jgi:hypothetical protein
MSRTRHLRHGRRVRRLGSLVARRQRRAVRALRQAQGSPEGATSERKRSRPYCDTSGSLSALLAHPCASAPEGHSL